jgi:protein-L-isoaspartate(D-aspartate) O-methyltransferase
MPTNTQDPHYTDTPLHQAMRLQMITALQQRGSITHPNVLAALGTLPRHWFLESAMLPLAYQDRPQAILSGQTISQPHTVAYQTQLLNVQPNDKILEIGTGSGYQSCILTHLGAKVYTIERHEALYNRTKRLLTYLNLMTNLHLFLGDGTVGLKIHAPYNKIIVTAGAPVVPQSLVEQLIVGGTLVIPVGDDTTQKMLRITKIDPQNSYQTETFDDFKFVPLIGKQGWNNTK